MPLLDRTYVRPRRSYGDVISTCLVAGTAIGALFVAIDVDARIGPFNVRACLPVVLALAAGVPAVLRWPRGGQVAVGGWFFTASMLTIAWCTWTSELRTLDRHVVLQLILALVAAGVGVVVAGAWIILWLIIDRGFAAHVVQDGTLCFGCAHRLTPEQARCPECGAARRAPRRWPRAWRWGRRALVLAALGCVVHAVLAPLPLLGAQRRFADFVSRSNSGRIDVSFYEMWGTTGRMVDGASHPAPGCIADRHADGNRAILVVYDPRPPDGRTVMQVRVVWTGTNAAWPAGIPPLPVDGIPSLAVDLEEAQAAAVLEHGVPPELVRALYEASLDPEWEATASGRGYSTSDVMIRFIDPAPYFPQTDAAGAQSP